MVEKAIAMIQRFLAPWRSGGDATPRPNSLETVTGGHDDQVKKDEDSQAAAMLERHIEERRDLKRQAIQGAVLIVVLLVLVIESIPLVVSDFHLQAQYDDQGRSLVQVEGFVTILDEVVSGGATMWAQRVSEQVDTAMRRINDLDAYDQLLASLDDSAPGRPVFLTACIGRNAEVADWIQTSDALRSNWPLVVERCIIEPMGADFDVDGRDQLTAPLAAAHTDVTAAIALARREFPQAIVPITSPPSAPLVIPTVESLARQSLDDIERSVNHVVRIVKAGPEEAISPPPTAWLVQFTGGDRTLRSFRDNMLLTYAGPYGVTAMTNRGDTGAQLSIRSLAPSTDTTHSLKIALNGVRESQKTLQESMDARIAELEPAIPDLLKPVLIVVKSTHLVLLFPLGVALVGWYLLMTYTRLWKEARHLQAAGATKLPLPFLFALVLAPLGLLLSLYSAYAWPQLAHHSEWHWSQSHRAPLLLFIGIALWYAFDVVAAIGAGDGDNRPASEHGAAAPSGQTDPAPEPRPNATQNSGLPQTNMGSLDA